MGISSLGLGSSILTQDVLDQLRDADEAGQIKPVTLDIANEGDKKDALELIDASMANLIDSINEIKSHGLFDERNAEVSGTSVEISAAANSDVQDFTLDVENLATKQIEQSGSFSTRDTSIADSEGTLNLNIDGEDFSIDYDEDTTLDDLKKSINDTAGDKVDATIVQIGPDDFRLFISSVETGSNQDITLSDTTEETNDKDDKSSKADKVKKGDKNSGKDSGNNNSSSGLKDGILSKLTTAFDLDPTQEAMDANFKFNGESITRTSNSVTDLISGLDITLKEVGITSVSITQDRETIMEKIDSFVEKYNSAMSELDKMTKPSIDSTSRGIFSGESTIKGMKNSIQDMMSTIGGGVAYIADFGFDIDKDGKMTVDKTVIDDKLDENPANVEAFFAGGTYTNSDDTTTELDGMFTQLSSKVEGYTKYNATLDQLKNSITDSISSLEERKTTATERLDAKYEILKRQYAAYDAMISKFNSASSMFTQMANAANNNS